jgi:hypothetical protein
LGVRELALAEQELAEPVLMALVLVEVALPGLAFLAQTAAELALVEPNPAQG